MEVTSKGYTTTVPDPSSTRYRGKKKTVLPLRECLEKSPAKVCERILPISMKQETQKLIDYTKQKLINDFNINFL